MIHPEGYHFDEIIARSIDHARYEQSQSFSNVFKMVGVSEKFREKFQLMTDLEKIAIVATAILKAAVVMTVKKITLEVKPHHDITKQGNEIRVTYFYRQDIVIAWYTLGILQSSFYDATAAQFEKLIEWYNYVTMSSFIPKTNKKEMRGHAFINYQNNRHYRLKYWANPAQQKISFEFIRMRKPLKIINFSELDQYKIE